MTPDTWIEIDEARLRANLQFLRHAIGEHARFCSVVKGNAYGHDLGTFVPLAERCGVREFAVSSAFEAEQVLRARAEASAVMVMGHLDRADLPWAVENDLSFFVFDLGRLDDALRAAKQTGRRARVHLEVETGLYRTGLTKQSLDGALRRIRAHPDHLELAGLCTHLSGAESSANTHRIQEQLDRFEERSADVDAAGVTVGARHVACSAAVFNYPHAVHDLARVGIAQYGYWPSEETRMAYFRTGMDRARSGRSKLARILCWKSRIMSLTTVPAGAFVGYGLSHQALHRSRIATVPVGYSHGLPRAQGNAGRVLVHGMPSPIVGAVSMNALTIDVTDIPAAKSGDEVVLIGEQGPGEISVGAFGEKTHILNYEVLSRLSPHIPRVVVRG